MATALKKLTGVGGDVRKIARLLQAKAPEGHMLAYITPEEASVLKQRGGSGKPHADTGIPSFQEEDFYAGLDDAGGTDVPVPAEVQQQYAQYYQEPVTSAPQAQIRGDTDVPIPNFEQVLRDNPELYPGYAITSGSPYSTVLDPRMKFASAVDLSEYRNFADFQKRYPPIPTSFAEVTRAQPDTSEAAAFRAAGIPTTPAEMQTLGARVGPVSEAKQEVEPSVIDQLSKFTGLSQDTLKKLGIAGVTGLLGRSQTAAAREGAQQGRRELEAVATPYRQQGLQLQAQAQRGELTPQAQQSLQAVQAQAAQQAQRRGGVGAAQTQQQIEAFRQQLLAQQYDLGLKISGIGDQIALGAIRTGMQADQYVNQLTNSYFTNVIRVLYGVAPETAQQQRGA
jgi:hypothetical protein